VHQLVTSLPWLIPGVVVALVVAVLTSGRVGAWLGFHRVLAAVLVFSLGVILAGTLTPLAADEVIPPEARATCDMSRTWLATPIDLLTRDDVLLNILLFMPFGFAVGSIPWSWRAFAWVPRVTAVPVTAALPLASE